MAQGVCCLAAAPLGSNIPSYAVSGYNSSTTISGRQLNLTGQIAQPIPLEIKTLQPRGEIFSPLE